MINELSATNFKSWRKIDGMRLAPITGLFGTNSSGKTSILQLLLMLKQSVESSDRSQVLELGDNNTGIQLGTYADLVFEHDTFRTVSVTLCWTLDGGLVLSNPDPFGMGDEFDENEIIFYCEVGRHEGKVFVELMSYQFGDHVFEMKQTEDKGKYSLKSASPAIKFERNVGRPWDLPPPVKFYGFPDKVYSFFKNAGFLAHFQLELEELFNKTFYLGPLREDPQRIYSWSGGEPGDMGHRGENAVAAMLSARSKGKYLSFGKGIPNRTLEEQVAIWLKELGLIHDFSVQRLHAESTYYEVKVRRSENSSEVLLTDVGFGVSQVLPILVLCYYVPEGSIVILEQPEIHLHPLVQSGLADVFIDAMRTRNIQIILESHSEHLLRRLQRRIAEQSLGNEDVAIYFCDTEEGHSTLSELMVDEFGNIQNWPKDFFGDDFAEMAAITKAAMKRKQEAAE